MMIDSQMADATVDAEEFPGRLLHQAALWDNADLLEDLLNGEYLQLINSRDTEGRTVLHAAVTNENPHCTRILLQAGADPNVACGSREENKTPLHVAAQHGNLEAMRLLLEWEADLLTRNSNGLTAMDLSEQGNHSECMHLLRQVADEREKLRAEFFDELEVTCVKGDTTRLKVLLKDPPCDVEHVINLCPNGSNTLLFKACEEGKRDIVEILLDCGADCRQHPVTKYSPFHIACYRGHKDVVELLLQKFPQLVQVTTIEQWLPIHAAVINGHVSVLDVLLKFSYPEHLMLKFQDQRKEWEYQMPFDINASDVTAQTVLFMASYMENKKIVELLLKFRVKAWKMEKEIEESVEDMLKEKEKSCRLDRTSPVKNKIASGIQDLISKLNLNRTNLTDPNLKINETFICPVEVNAYCNDGCETALHAAVRAKNYAIVSLLLTNNADPNLKMRQIEDDENGVLGKPLTALVEACQSRNHLMIDLLLKHGARDEDKGALSVSVQLKDDLVVSKLLTLRAHPDPEYKLNRKAFDVIPATQFKTLGIVNSVTPSSMFPSTPVMLNWHGHQCLTQLHEQWLVDASLSHNPKLKLTPKTQGFSLLAITRLDISNNLLLELPDCVFQLQSLRHLNAAQNKLERLPGDSKIETSSPKHRLGRSEEEESVYQCPVLEEIYLQDNRLDSVPANIFHLPSLMVFDLSNNKLQNLPFKMWTAPKLKELNVSFNLLKDLPLRFPRHAVSIDQKLGHRDNGSNDLVSSNKCDLSPQRNCTNSTSNSEDSEMGDKENVMEHNYPVALTPQSAECSLPKELSHHNFWCHTIEISESYLDGNIDGRDNQSQLTMLNLAHNAFISIPVGLSCVAVNLTRLNLSYNRLCDMGMVNNLPSSLKQIDFSHNQIRNWFSLGNSDCEVCSESQSPLCYGISESIPSKTLSPGCKLTRPKRGSHTSLSSLSTTFCIHRRHTRLDNLRTLILSDNKLTRFIFSLDDDRLSLDDEDDYHNSVDVRKGVLKSFGSFILFNSCFKDILKNPASSNKYKIMFPNLSLLDVSNNFVREIPSLISELSNLSVFNISGNTEICHLPPEMGLLSKLWNLNTRGCNLYEPLKTMIESKKYKTMDVVGYLKSILENAKPYARMKLMIVGVQGIGKTSLLEQLRQEGSGSYRKKPNEHWAKRMGNKNINLKTAKGFNISTVGVDIGDWTYEKKVRGQSSYGSVTFRTWDFGGQKEYYSTHQYFLSKRSLYLVVWKITDGQRGARAPNSPVLIIGTHYDLVKEKFPPCYSEDLQQFIRDRFINVIDADKCGLPRVLDTIEISCKTRHNVKLLCNLIYDTVFELRSAGSKERLLEQRIPATYLALEDVVGYLALERRLQNKDPVLQSEQYKYDSVLLHYEDAALKDLYFLDPQWLCDMLAHIVTIREINPFARTGIMKMDDLKHIFKTSHCTSVDTKSYIVNLLNKFEVALTWDSRTLLIPSLLPTEEQLHLGLPGCDVRIPVRSRGWAMRCKAFQTSAACTLVGNSQFYLQLDPMETRICRGLRSLHLRSELGEEGELNAASNSDCEILHRNNPQLSIRRLLLMSYFPSGFWSRLITRMLADDSVVDIIRAYLMLPFEVQQDAGMVNLLERHRAEWLCWQTGMELHYANTTLFRMKEVLLNTDNPSGNYHHMHLMLQQDGNWSAMDVSSSAILELYIPNQTVVLQRRFNLPREKSESGDIGDDDEAQVDGPCYQRIILDPNPDCIAKLLAITVDHIDTLLEDWYPTLGTRFVHTSEGKFLITRLVPCPQCLNDQIKRDSMAMRFGGDGEAWQMVGMKNRGEPCVMHDVSLVNRSAERQRLLGMPPRYNHNNHRSRDSATSHDSDSGVGPDSTNSSRKASAEGQSDSDVLSAHDQNGEDVILVNTANEVVYSYMVEECILAAYESRKIQCPDHGELSLFRIAPDVVFLDLGERFVVRPETIKRGKMLGRGAFGFVFKATVKHRGSNSFIEVAMKMLQPVDPGFGARQSAAIAFKAAQSKWQRDPIQYACKAYCTARQELNIVLSLRHPNIVPLIGVCTQPLALILELAPLGALDAILRNYRRSGAQLQLHMLQKIIFQVAKALEYLHQQHIIYRDLKSENVLVWSLPPPFESNCNSAVDVKLADYGISRSTLPTGTKGFGGTEGFMAPEIMRYNGEEEYTEKVDCFSFGMFMYELLTLHLPFEGHELVKDQILDGGRPTLTRRETLYPTYMLDLMVLCWSQQPKDRPSASQIVSIASAPEFVHLLDVVSLEEQTAVICASCVTFPDETDYYDSSCGPRLDVWLSRLGQQLDILTCNSRSWQNIRTLKSNSVTITEVCVVKTCVWLGDSKGIVHIYNAFNHTELDSFALDPDAATTCAVRSMCYIAQLDKVAVSLSNGRLWLYASDYAAVKGGTDCQSTSELGSNGSPIFCTTSIRNARTENCELWCGQSHGMISIFAQREGVIISQEIVNHYEPALDNSDVLQLVASNENGSVWSYIYPGCIIYHWDADTRTVLNKLDCSKLVPCSESLKSISIEEHLSPGRCQVTAMASLGDNLYVGTTWGCIVVAEGATLRPVTIFRPFEEEVKAILPAFQEPKDDGTTPSGQYNNKPGATLITVGRAMFINTSPISQPDCSNLLIIKGNQAERIKQEGGKDNVVEVKASAEIRLPPDRAVVSIQVFSMKDNAKDAKNSVDRRTSYIFQTLRSHAIKDVEFMSHLKRDEMNFTMTTQVTVKFTDFAACLKIVNLLAEKLDRSVKITEPVFYHSTKSLQAARKDVCIKAAQIARDKAQELSRIFSATLGKLLSVREDKSVSSRLEQEKSTSELAPNSKYSLNMDTIKYFTYCYAKSSGTSASVRVQAPGTLAFLFGLCDVISQFSTVDIAGRHTGQDIAGRHTGQDIAGRHTGQDIAGRHTGQDIAGRHTGQDIAGRHTGQDIAGRIRTSGP
uniref:non-specific serine/threonine protein kinase n=1 Tax=Strigamia maritima TaxID=126957 RepID=T1IVJ9_STRMM